ncbi:MAG: transporter [Herbaspirillum sp.]|jgi:phospholipid-binding lipoprotein MlaA|nr:transporter [Herbaspirillum sp.]
MNNKTRIAMLILAGGFLGGCATAQNPNDPLEGFNRAIFTFNDTLDRAAVKPVAQAYSTVVPSFVQTGIGNFFGNLGDVWSAVNQLLQGNGADGVSDILRVAVNTTFGLGGLLDIGTEARLPSRKADFGQTLGVWGVGSGPYLVLPVFGPSNIRDSVALVADQYGDLWSYKYPVRWRNVGYGVRLIDRRAQLLNAGNLLDDAALDKYQFMRDAYIQRRASQIEGAKHADQD